MPDTVHCIPEALSSTPLARAHPARAAAMQPTFLPVTFSRKRTADRSSTNTGDRLKSTAARDRVSWLMAML